MAITNTNLAATLQRREKGYSNIVSSQIPFYFWFKKKGRYMKWDGGHPYEWNLEVALDTSEPSYDGYDTIPISPQDNVVTASANMKHYLKWIAINGPERRINTGMKVFDLLKQKEKNALESGMQQFNDHLYLDGTGNSSKRITGLAAIIATSPTTGELFGVDRAVVTFHRNRIKDTNAAALDISDGNPVMWNDMEILRTECGRQKIGGMKDRWPDLILCTEGYFQKYQQVGQIMGLRFVDTDTLDAGFDNLKYHNAVMIPDEDFPDDAGSDDQACFINSAFMKLLYHPDFDWKLGNLERMESQDAFAAPVIWAGELIATAVGKLGRHEGIQAVAT